MFEFQSREYPTSHYDCNTNELAQGKFKIAIATEISSPPPPPPPRWILLLAYAKKPTARPTVPTFRWKDQL
eukprot:4878662-Amphidinium_carterae.1